MISPGASDAVTNEAGRHGVGYTT